MPAAYHRRVWSAAPGFGSQAASSFGNDAPCGEEFIPCAMRSLDCPDVSHRVYEESDGYVAADEESRKVDRTGCWDSA